MVSSELDEPYSWLPSVLQTTDPLFPIGSYAHSYGLEEMVAMGRVSDENGLLDFIQTHVFENLEKWELPYLRFSYNAISSENWQIVIELDQELDASKMCSEIRQASIAQGRQRLRLLRKINPDDLLNELSRLKREEHIKPHHLVVFAAEYLIHKAPLKIALAAWTYQALAAPCAASLKLMRIGQEGAQSVLTKALESIPSIIEKSMYIEREYAGSFNPLLDIACDRHEQAFSRLFIS